MRLKGHLQILRSLPLLLGTCLSAVSAEPPSKANPKGPADGEKLMAIRGLPLTHKMVEDVMTSFDLKKVRTICDEVHRTEIDGVAQTDRVEITTHFLASDKTVEIVVKENQGENQLFSRKPYVDLIRIGLPRAGAAYPFAVSKTQGLTPSQATENLQAQTMKAVRLFPYGINTSMTPEQIHQLCDRPYAAGVGVIGKSGNGSIKFFEDPISPFPITVWFENGVVCGVDIHTWGPRSENKVLEQDGASGGDKPKN